MEHPDEGFNPNEAPEEIERKLERQAKVVERDSQWIDPEERVGGD